MKYFLVISLSLLVCLSNCKIEIEEVDEFEEFEESPRTDGELKTKDEPSPVADKAEPEITVEVYLKSKIIQNKYIEYLTVFSLG